jgi:hypothetical protein
MFKIGDSHIIIKDEQQNIKLIDLQQPPEGSEEMSSPKTRINMLGLRGDVAALLGMVLVAVGDPDGFVNLWSVQS